MNKLLEQSAAKEAEFFRMKEALERVEEALITMKRKNAGAAAKAQMMEKMTKADEPDNVLDVTDPEELVNALKTEFIKHQQKAESTFVTHDLKLKQLMPLVADKGKKGNDASPLETLEKKLNKKIQSISTAQASEVA